MTPSASGPPALLAAQGISVTFGGVKALSDVNCSVGASEIVGIIGPNGAGKTTLLNSVSRVNRPSSNARILLNGVDLMRHRPRELVGLGLSRTFQTPQVSPTSTVWANVLMGAHARLRRGGRDHASRREVDEEAWDLLGVFGIGRWARAQIDDVPYATRKRAEICRALLSRPSILLLDEPASGMSHPEKADLATALKAVHAQRGTAILVIEHDVGFLAGLCGRLIALNFGQKIADGPPDAVIADEAVVDAYLGRDES